MKKYLSFLLIITVALFIYSCGGGGSSGGPHLGGSSSSTSYQLTKNIAIFYVDQTNMGNSTIPFPNDILTSQTRSAATERSLFIPTEGAPISMAAFYTAINDLNLQGFSPNTPISIPLATDKILLNQGELQSNVKALDITRLVGLTLTKLPYTPSSTNDYCYLFSLNKDNSTLALACAETILGYYSKANPQALGQFIGNISPYIYTPMIVKQNGNVINGYPIVPFNPGDRYVVVVENGIKNLEASTIVKSLLGSQKLSGALAELEPVREAYTGLLPLLEAVGISRNNIVEMFTFTVAKKTLGLEDYAQVGLAASGAIPLSSMKIEGYPYSELDNLTYAGPLSQNEYLQIDSLSDLPLLCQNLYDNSTLRAYLASQGINLPEITDNLQSYMLTPNVYGLSDIETILTQYNFPDNQTAYPYVCVKIFTNPKLYDNVTTAIYGNKLNPKGIIIFQHGLGKDKSDAGILANDPALSDYEFFAMDLPWHGDRVRPYNMLGVPVPSPTCDPTKSGSCYLTSNAIDDVMNIYQSLLDMHTFTKFVYAGDVKTMAETGIKLTGNPLPPLPVYFAGQSMGSITGSMLLNIDNITSSQLLARAGLKPSNYISKAVLNVGGANYSSILNEATNPEIMGLLCGALGIPENSCTPENVAKYRDTVKYNMTIALFQLVLDAVDPSFMARNPSLKPKVIVQSAFHDTLVPNISNELLYADYLTPPYSGLYYTPISCDNTTITATPGWYMFIGNAPYSWINHGFLIHTAPTIDELYTMYPSAKGHMSLECVNNAEELSREQIDRFFTPAE